MTNSLNWIIPLSTFCVLLFAVCVYGSVKIYKQYYARKKRKEYSAMVAATVSGDKVAHKKKSSVRLFDSTTPRFSGGDVREFHVQPGLSPILPSRKLSEPEHSRKYSDPVPPYRKISSDILSYRERTRTISESTLSGPATPLGSLDPQLYAFEELEDPFDKQAESASHLGQLQFIVEYDLHRHILAVRLVRAINLSLPSTYDEPAAKPCNPYAIVELLPDYRHQLQSNVQRKTSHPRFDETFEFDVEIKNLQQQFLWITVLSFETFSKHDVIGQVVVPLSDLNLSKKSVLLKGLEPSVKEIELGEIYISLGYLKSAERLTLVVIKARNLPAVNIKGTDPYVKVTLLQDGKRLKKKKTSTKKGDLNPVFNEAVSFDLSADLLDSVDLLISVMHGNDVIGSVLIGSRAKENEAKLWTRMYSSDRPLPHWSMLQDPKLYY